MVRFLGEEELPEGAPRATRRKKAKALTAPRTVFASFSEEIGGTPFVFWYAGERSAFIADLPGHREYECSDIGKEMGGRHL